MGCWVKKILVIDDNASILKAIKKILEKEGHDIITAEDGTRGITAIANTHFDLVISDMIMPDQDGQDVGKYIKEKALNIPLLIITGGGTLLTKEMAADIAKSITPYILLKPFDSDSLLDKLQEIF
jgi:DNA-binding NtrC family response regulator